MPPMCSIDLLVTVARLHFVEGRSQSEIAQLLGLSRATVSRAILACRDQGIVEFRVDTGHPHP